MHDLLDLTPSFVQIQLVQGLGKADSPTLVCLPPIVQPVTTFSRHALKSICGIEWQGTRGFLKKPVRRTLLQINLFLILQEVAWKVKGSALHVSGNVQVVADDLGQRCLSQFGELSFSKSDVCVFVFIPGNKIFYIPNTLIAEIKEFTRNDHIFSAV